MAEFEDAREERRLLMRLEGMACIGVAVPERIAAARRLEAKGLVVCWWGEGKDDGLLMLRKVASGRPPPWPRHPSGGLRA